MNKTTVTQQTAERSGFVITTTINGRKQYVAGQFTRSDNFYLVHYDTNEKKATPFATEVEADKYRRKIYNTLNRVFNIEPATLPSTGFKPAKFSISIKEKIA